MGKTISGKTCDAAIEKFKATEHPSDGLMNLMGQCASIAESQKSGGFTVQGTFSEEHGNPKATLELRIGGNAKEVNGAKANPYNLSPSSSPADTTLYPHTAPQLPSQETFPVAAPTTVEGLQTKPTPLPQSPQVELPGIK